MNLSFTPAASDADIALLRDLASRIWPPTFSPILPPAQIPYMLRIMYAPDVIRAELDSGIRWVVVRADSTPVGYLSWGPAPDLPSVAKLHKVYLLPSCHSRGIGQLMLDHALNACRDEGYVRVVLAVNKRNDRAIRAYRRRGFALASEIVTDIGSGFVMDDFLMSIDL